MHKKSIFLLQYLHCISISPASKEQILPKKKKIQKREELIVEISPSGAELKRIPLEQFRNLNKI